MASGTANTNWGVASSITSTLDPNIKVKDRITALLRTHNIIGSSGRRKTDRIKKKEDLLVSWFKHYERETNTKRMRKSKSMNAEERIAIYREDPQKFEQQIQKLAVSHLLKIEGVLSMKKSDCNHNDRFCKCA